MEEGFDSANYSERVKEVRRNNILAAKVLSDTVSSTLGPRGMDKMLVDRVGNITITNDGATILSEMELDHPVAKMIVGFALNQEKEAGDGTTTTVMLAGKLLENSEKLLERGIHPTLISKFYRIAYEKSKDILREIAYEIKTEKEFLKIAETAMTGKALEYSKEKLSKLVVDIVKTSSEKGELNLKDIQIKEMLGKGLNETQTIKGLVIDREKSNADMPSLIENVRILVMDSFLGIKNLESESQITIRNLEELEKFSKREENLLRDLIQKVISSSANVLISRDSVDSRIKFYLAREGIYVLERVPFEDIELISKATNAKIFSNIDDVSPGDLGEAKYLEEREYSEGKMTLLIEPINKKVVTILLFGETEQILNETKRVIEDALFDSISVFKDSLVLPGGGASEMEISKRILDFSRSLPLKEKTILEEFAKTLEYIPKTLAENAGMNSIEILNEIKRAHYSGKKNHGINLFSESVEDTLNAGIIEPLKVKLKALSNAVEIAVSILRLDDIIASEKSSAKGGKLSSMQGLD